MRGTFANIRLRNALADGARAASPRHLPVGEQMSIYDAAERYAAEGVPLVVIAGKEYGSGSSRDWAAKGTALLGVRAVIAAELRAHPPLEPGRLGVLPLQFRRGRLGREPRARRHRDVHHPRARRPRRRLARDGRAATAASARSTCLARLDAPADVTIYRAGGLLQMVMRQLVRVA